MKNLIFKKQLIILISVFILVIGISTVSANDLRQNIETYDNNTNLDVDDNNISQTNETIVKSNVTIDVKDVKCIIKMVLD